MYLAYKPSNFPFPLLSDRFQVHRPYNRLLEWLQLLIDIFLLRTICNKIAKSSPCLIDMCLKGTGHSFRHPINQSQCHIDQDCSSYSLLPPKNLNTCQLHSKHNLQMSLMLLWKNIFQIHRLCSCKTPAYHSPSGTYHHCTMSS